MNDFNGDLTAIANWAELLWYEFSQFHLGQSDRFTNILQIYGDIFPEIYM